MRAPTKSPTMGGRQQCRHGEPAHVCPWCSYENGKEDGRKAERAKIVEALLVRAGEFPAMTERAKALVNAAAWLESEKAAT